MNTLNGKKFKTFSDFIKTFDDVEICKKKTKKYLSEDFKIFIIMDTDDCTEQQKRDYISKDMFKNHWAYPYIVPIYNIPELESVLVKSKIKFEKKGDARKKEYIKIFPTDSQYSKRELIQAEEFCNNLKSNANTNLDEFVGFCIEISEQ